MTNQDMTNQDDCTYDLVDVDDLNNTQNQDGESQILSLNKVQSEAAQNYTTSVLSNNKILNSRDFPHLNISKISVPFGQPGFTSDAAAGALKTQNPFSPERNSVSQQNLGIMADSYEKTHNLSGNVGHGLEGSDKLDNPDEIELEGEEDMDDDPEILEEIEKRHDEIVGQFMEMSLSYKHEMREQVIQEQEEGGDSEELQEKLKKVNKEMDDKRKAGLKKLKKQLNEIISDEDLSVNEKLQRLSDDSQI